MAKGQGLAGYKPATREVELPDGGSIAVRGLSLTDITSIYRNHAGDLGLWFERLGGQEVAVEASMVEALVTTAPTLVAELVGLAGGADAEIAATLPMAVQIDALTKIGELTFTRDMPPKKVLETVLRLAASAAAQAPTTSGSS